jgi:hypothetical protein
MSRPALYDEQRQSLLEFIPGDSLLWIKDHAACFSDTLDLFYEKVIGQFQNYTGGL